jgi:hypothetical protein
MPPDRDRESDRTSVIIGDELTLTDENAIVLGDFDNHVRLLGDDGVVVVRGDIAKVVAAVRRAMRPLAKALAGVTVAIWLLGCTTWVVTGNGTVSVCTQCCTGSYCSVNCT